MKKKKELQPVNCKVISYLNFQFPVILVACPVDFQLVLLAPTITQTNSWQVSS